MEMPIIIAIGGAILLGGVGGLMTPIWSMVSQSQETRPATTRLAVRPGMGRHPQPGRMVSNHRLVCG